MRWKHRRKLYRDECMAYVKSLLEQHKRRIFPVSCIDEAPGTTLREKLHFLLNEAPEYPRTTRSVRHRMQVIRDDALEWALRQSRKEQHQ